MSLDKETECGYVDNYLYRKANLLKLIKKKNANKNIVYN